MNGSIDIHRFQRVYKTLRERIEEAPISGKNKKLILKFDQNNQFEGLSLSRRINIMRFLHILIRDYLHKDFDEVKKPDLKRILADMENRPNLSVATVQQYKTNIKKFFKWLEYGDDYKDVLEYPNLVKWIRTTIKKKYQTMINPGQIFTIEEIDRMVQAAEHPRDQAFVIAHYEAGSRIGELGGSLLNSLVCDEFGYLTSLNGKTGLRTIRLGAAAPLLTNWLNVHPARDNPEAPLWVRNGNRDKQTPMYYCSYSSLIKRIAKKAGIRKRVHTHIFRHSRVTHVLAYNIMNESQAKIYFGWVPDSSMIARYSHLVTQHANDALLEKYGLKKKNVKINILKPKVCSKCSYLNAYFAQTCQQCTNSLEIGAVKDVNRELVQSEQMISQFLNDPKVQELFKKKYMEMQSNGPAYSG